MQVGPDRDPVGFRARDAMRHRHRLGRRGRLVQQRGIGDLHPRQVADQGLEDQQRLQPSLRDLRLIGRIGGVPGRDSPARCAGSPRAGRCRGSPGRSAPAGCRCARRARRSSASTPASSTGGGRSSGAAVRIAPGTARAASASSESIPRLRSIAAISAADGPICRPTKPPSASSAASVARGSLTRPPPRGRRHRRRRPSARRRRSGRPVPGGTASPRPRRRR